MYNRPLLALLRERRSNGLADDLGAFAGGMSNQALIYGSKSRCCNKDAMRWLAMM